MTRKELMRLMPATGDDLAGATRIIELGYPAVAPVMRDIVRWLGVAESRVADAFAAFLGRLGEAAAPALAEGLQRENCWLRHRVFCQILPVWPPEAVRQLTSMLSMVATQPDAYNNDIRSVLLLAEHRLVDMAWSKGWLEFNRERLDERNELLTRAEQKLGPSSPDPD